LTECTATPLLPFTTFSIIWRAPWAFNICLNSVYSLLYK
jgi:hypothetical protein